MPDAYLVILQDRDDIEVKLVDKEIWDWFFSPPPEFVGHAANEFAGLSERLKEGFRFEWNVEGYAASYPEAVNVTSGSYENDRMLLCPDTLCLFSHYGDTDSIGLAHEWAARHGYTIVETHEGAIY